MAKNRRFRSIRNHQPAREPRGLRVLKYSIAVLLACAVISTVLPIRTLLVTENQYRAMDRIEKGMAEISRTAFLILMTRSTPRDEQRLIRSVQDYEQAFAEAVGTVVGIEEFAHFKAVNDYIVGRLDYISGSINRLRTSSLRGGNMPLIERQFTIRTSGLEEDGRTEGYVLLTEIIDEVDFLLGETLPLHQAVAIEIDDLITLRRVRAFRMLTVGIFLYLAAIALAVVVAAVDRIQRARTAENAALDRSEALEHLVRARTEDLEIQNRELKETRNMLVEREKMQALGQIVSGVAHEVNTPLGICVTATTFLADRISDESISFDRQESKEVVDLILSNVTRASKLIKGFKKVAVDELDDAIRSFDLVPYLQEDLIPGLKPMIRAQHHDIAFQGPVSCPMYGYPGSIAQLLTNLVQNASIHGYGTVPGGVIHIALETDEHQVTLSITDDGAGMNEETQKRIYEPFFTTTREEGGSGLGLMVVYNIVRGKLGGQIDCRTAPGKGTTFTVVLPTDMRDAESAFPVI